MELCTIIYADSHMHNHSELKLLTSVACLCLKYMLHFSMILHKDIYCTLT